MRRLARACAVGATLGLTVSLTPLPAAGQDGPIVGQCTPPSVEPIKEESWAQKRMAPERAWHLTKGGVIVGVIDTGVSAEAPTLNGAVLTGTNLTGSGGKAGDGDCFGSGTFIASLIAARPDDDPHVPFVGVAPEARIFPVRVSDNPPMIQDHVWLAEAIAAGIKDATDGGAKVIAVGLVATVNVPELSAAVAYAHRHDVLIVASASPSKTGQLAFPARLPSVIAVAPVAEDGPTGNSTLGTEPELAGPATEVIGVGPQGSGHRVSSAPQLAVGFVAGTAALVRDYHPGMSAQEVSQQLRISADHPSTTLPNESIGYGVVNPYAAVTTVPDTDPAVEPPPENLVVPMPQRPDPAPARRALWWTGGVTAAALLVAGPTVAMAARRRREK